MSWPPPPLPELATDRFALIVTALIGYVRTKIRAGVEWALFNAAQAHVRRIRNRFAALVVKYRAGTLPAPRPKRPPPAIEPPDGSEPDESEQKPKPVRPVSLLPRNFAWLCGIVPQWAAGCGGQVLHLLDEPEMRDLIAAAPQAGRLLRPLLWMTGRHCPDFLALPPRVRAPRHLSPADPSDADQPVPAADPIAACDTPAAPSAAAPAAQPAARPAARPAAGLTVFRG